METFGQGNEGSAACAVGSNDSRNRRKVVLSNRLAFEIYLLKIKILMQRNRGFFLGSSGSTNFESVLVSMHFGVSPKTIRDVWNRRTWRCSTGKLWQHEDHLHQHSEKLTADDKEVTEIGSNQF
jgi:hypothetical protein